MMSEAGGKSCHPHCRLFAPGAGSARTVWEWSPGRSSCPVKTPTGFLLSAVTKDHVDTAGPTLCTGGWEG